MNGQNNNFQSGPGAGPDSGAAGGSGGPGFESVLADVFNNHGNNGNSSNSNDGGGGNFNFDINSAIEKVKSAASVMAGSMNSEDVTRALQSSPTLQGLISDIGRDSSSYNSAGTGPGTVRTSAAQVGPGPGDSSTMRQSGGVLPMQVEGVTDNITANQSNSGQQVQQANSQNLDSNTAMEQLRSSLGLESSVSVASGQNNQQNQGTVTHSGQNNAISPNKTNNLNINLNQSNIQQTPSQNQQPQREPDTKPRVRRHELGPEREFRVLVDDKLYEPVTIKVVCSDSTGATGQGDSGGPGGKKGGDRSDRIDRWANDDPSRTCEINGREMVLELDYPIMPGSRNGFFTWKGCTLQITGGTVQEFVDMNLQMRDYANSAAIVERRRVKAAENAANLGGNMSSLSAKEQAECKAPRILITGENGSGKSVVSELFYNYALRHERTPIYVDTDPRYTASVSESLRGLPACIHAVIPDLIENDVTKRLTFFFGDLDWRGKHQRLYEQICIRLATVVKAKLSGLLEDDNSSGSNNQNNSSDNSSSMMLDGGDVASKIVGLSASKRIVQSGMIMNGPEGADAEILNFLIKEFQIDVVFVLCDPKNQNQNSVLSEGRKLTQELKQLLVSENVDIIPLEKTTGAYLENSDTLRMQRHQRMRDYFQGVSPISNGFPQPPSPTHNPAILNSGQIQMKNTYSNPLYAYQPLSIHYGSFPLSHMNLLQYTTTRIQHPNGVVMHQLATQVFEKSKYQQLIHTALGVIRAQSEQDLLYAQLAGYIIVTGLEIEKNILHVAMPSLPPLPSNYFLVPTDIPNMTYIDALTPPS